MQQDRLSYVECLKVAWLLTWRGAFMVVLITGGFGGILAYVFGMLRFPPVPRDLFALMGGVLIGFFVVSPWVLRMMFGKRYTGFQLRIDRF